MTEMGSPMNTAPRFGVNYVPSRGWWYCWSDWEDQAIAEDLAVVAGLGVDHIRIHCLWPLFQPNPGLVSESMLGNLRSLMDIADAAGLDVIVTVFNGWLSGFDFRPSWIDDGVSIFTDPTVVSAQRTLLTAIAHRVGGHRRFLGFDIANEPSVLATDTKNVTTQQQGDTWVRELLTHCEELVPGRLHSVGMDHVPWITSRSAFSRETLATTGSVTPIHAWIYFTGALERYGPTGTGTRHLTEYMLELAKAYHQDVDRPVWLQEFGVAVGWMDEPERTDFVSLATAITGSVDGLWGMTWWCSHDIERTLGGFEEIEYDFGLFTIHNTIKPAGIRLRDAISAIRTGNSEAPAIRSVALELPDGQVPDLTFADDFFELIEGGIRPTIVLQSRSSDPQYLASRGIDTVHRATAGDRRTADPE